MASEMVLVPKEQWNRLKKEAEQKKKEEEESQETKKRKLEGQEEEEEIGITKELLSKLTKDLEKKNGVTDTTRGSGVHPVKKKKKKKKKKKNVKNLKVHIPPPPGVPDQWTPVALEKDTRDLAKKTPFIKGWEAY